MNGISTPRVPPLFPVAVIAAVSQLAGNRSAAGQKWWGGWDSNPGPADYESRWPSGLVKLADLGGYGSARSWSHSFGHAFGMIKLDAGPGPAA